MAPLRLLRVVYSDMKSLKEIEATLRMQVDSLSQTPQPAENSMNKKLNSSFQVQPTQDMMNVSREDYSRSIKEPAVFPNPKTQQHKW
jgi:hypothetical protein